jgi:hypothetical protein
MALIWDLAELEPEIQSPLLEYGADGKITNVAWSTLNYEWIGLCFDTQLQILRVY